MSGFWGPVLAIAWKDVLLELRTKDIVTSVLVFGIVTVAVFSFAITPSPQTVGLVAPGILWVAFTFAGSLAVNRSFVLEKEQGGLEGLMLCPVSRDVIYLGKLAGNFLFMLAEEVVILPVFAVLFNVNILDPFLWLTVLLATLGFASLGTLFSAISVNTRSREVLLPVLFFPMVVPVIIGAVGATGVVLNGEGWGDMTQWLALLGVFAAVFLVASAALFGYTLEE